MDNFFFGKNKFSKSESNQEFTEISSNYSRTYSKGKSFKFSIWNEVDTYNNDEFVQDFVQWNQKLWAAKKTSTNIPPAQGEYWELIVEGVSDVEFKQEDNRILWKYEDDLEWKDLFELDSVSEDQIKKMLEDLDIKYRNTYDDTLSLTSTNAVQNQAVTKKFKELDDKNTRTDNELTNIKSSVNTALSNSQSYTDSKISETKIQIDSKLDNLDSSLNSALTSAKSYTNSEITKVDNKIKSEISRAQASETNLSNRINNLGEDVIKSLNEAKEYTDALANGEVKNNTNKINILNGTGEGSVIKTVKDEISNLVGTAPEKLDTLQEIADYLEEHEDMASGLVNSLSSLEQNKVDKVPGKGLSTEDYTTKEKNKLAGLNNYDDTAITAELSALETKVTENKTATDKAVSDLSAKVDEEVESLQTRLDNHDTLIEDLQENKADKDGVYSGMTVGRSIDLLGVEDVEEGSFLFRPTDGDGSIKDGVAVVKSVKGNSVVWNQCAPTERDAGTADNTSGSSIMYIPTNVFIKYNKEINGHIIYAKVEDACEDIPYYYFTDNIQKNLLGGIIFTANTASTTRSIIHAQIPPGINASWDIKATFIDLTQMFGAGNEPSTIEDFYARMATLCIEDMNAYNEGEVVNMKASGIKSVGFNAWDEEWELGSIGDNSGILVSSSNTIRSKNYIKAIGGNEYYFGYFGNAVTWGRVHYYDAEKKWIGSIAKTLNGVSFIPPLNCAYIKFRMGDGYGSTYNHDICINLVHSGYRNGEYEPYVEDVIALPTLDLFPNGMNKIGYVYDEYDSEKSVQRIGIRPYQSGDESIENVLTDGTTTLYVLEEPIVTPHDYRLAYKAWDFGTEQVIADGNTTAITAGITYEFNARDTIRSNKTRLDVLEPIVAGKIDKEADDYYPQLAVGLADNLAGVDVVDSEINFRRSGGGAISDGVARIEAIKGNSMVWNQCFGNGATNKDYLKWEGNKATINGEFDADNVSYDIVGSGAKFVAPITNHKYLVEIDVISGTISGGIIVHYLPFADKAMNISENKLSAKTFVTSTITPSYYFVRTISAGVIATNLKVMYRVTDLTKAFPNDWQNINTIEEFYSRIPMGVDLNAYNEGEVVHMDVQSIESQGVNAWDEEWENGIFSTTTGANINSEATNKQIRSKNRFRVVGGEEYYSNVVDMWAILYDAEGNTISNPHATLATSNKAFYVAGKFKLPTNAAYMRFYMLPSYGTTYNHDICINISDTSINGKYFPYIKRTEDLSIIRKYFPQGMKSAGTAHDEIRYNKATQKWEYSKGKIKALRLADLVWYYSSANGYFYSKNIDNLKSVGTNKINILCDVIVSCDWSNFVENYGGNKATMIAPYTAAGTTKSRVNILNAAYTDVSAFIAWLEEANATLYYESNDWEWVELDAEDQFRDLDYQVWNCGTEKAIAEGISAPLAADITYGFNAIGKIKELESLVAALRAKVGI